MTTYRIDHEALEARVKQQQQEELAAKNWLEFVQRHPEVRLGGLANKNIFISYFAAEYPASFTIDALEEAYPVVRRQLALDDADGTRERTKLLGELTELTGEIPGTAKYQSTDNIRTKVDELRRRQEMQGKTPAELRQIIKENTPVHEPDDLPSHMDRSFLLSINKPGEFRKVCERYGVAAVTRRLNQR